MTILDARRMAETAAQAGTFLDQKPYPWISLQGVVQDQGFRRLCAEPPSIDLFQREFGKTRGYGQQQHDRLALQFNPGMASRLPDVWREFIDELHRPPYQEFIRKMYGLGRNEGFVLTMHWHFAPAGASVSPHVDASRKIGSHIFYLNTQEDWDPAWGGQTVVLDDAGRLRPHSAPGMDELPEVAQSQILGNRSFMFMRTDHSWHAVRPIACPPDRLRKVFIVVINRLNFQVLWRRARGKDPDGYPLRAA